MYVVETCIKKKETSDLLLHFCTLTFNPLYESSFNNAKWTYNSPGATQQYGTSQLILSFCHSLYLSNMLPPVYDAGFLSNMKNLRPKGAFRQGSRQQQLVFMGWWCEYAQLFAFVVSDGSACSVWCSHWCQNTDNVRCLQWHHLKSIERQH